jgi:hypothetical protein
MSPVKAQKPPAMLKFHPEWWWDPPELIAQLKPDVIRQLAAIHAELGRATAEAQLKAAEQVAAALRGMK